MYRACATFQASFPVDPEYGHPEGCYLARKIESRLRSVFPEVHEFDNWRDCGWSVSCMVESTLFWICFARYVKHEEWQLFVEPLGAYSGKVDHHRRESLTSKGKANWS
jgi:hypothetical protein